MLIIIIAEPSRQHKKDFYELLGVDRKASQSEIKKAYYSVCKNIGYFKK
jgi:hypothetical protein